FIFIAVFSVYPRIISIYQKSNSPTPVASSLVVVLNDKKVYKNKNANEIASFYVATPTKPTEQFDRNSSETTDIIDLSKFDKTANTETAVGDVTLLNNNFDKQLPKYKEGEYQGATANAYYGYVQTKVTIRNGKISDVKFLKFPNSSRNSIYLSNQAMPRLKQEIIEKQSENVDIVSGATYTSLAFIQSTKGALLKARN
ncbi:MAG TPA: FMN-binding protein, partial [Ignavibacteria bacterium]|nr:FMN-binding protein [Ignavibacteria bacterium]